MQIDSISINNYKSFFASGTIDLSPGFNVIVGENNAGKTAVAQALSLQFHDAPHRSLETVPRVGNNPEPQSYVKATISLNPKELIELLLHLGPNELIVPIAPNGNGSEELEKLRQAITCPMQIRLTKDGGGGLREASHKDFSVPLGPNFRGCRLSINEETHAPSLSQPGAYDPKRMFMYPLAQALLQRIYWFKAERFNVGEAHSGPEHNLAPDASNLAQVLHYLQVSNVSRFERLNQMLRIVFPDIKQVTVPPINNQDCRILLWSIDPKSERSDLAIPLSESGTGVGQVLAILYVILTADYPRTIIIDEPQSFIHPGAIRKLFDILRQHSQHQYIVTTHSPNVIAAAEPEAMLLVRKVVGKSTVERVDVQSAQGLRLSLLEVGSRLSDVFGPDNILWVEGATEEACFQIILSEVAQRPLIGTAIVGMISTGDLEGRHSNRILEIYRRLSTGSALLPPALAFIFDREARSKKGIDDMQRSGKGKIHFLPRRMFENYLLLPNAIAAVIKEIEGFSETPVGTAEIEKLLDEKVHKYAAPMSVAQSGEALAETDGARVLGETFSELSDGRVSYDKVRHGVALTSWIAMNAPNELRDLTDFLVGLLPDVPAGLDRRFKIGGA